MNSWTIRLGFRIWNARTLDVRAEFLDPRASALSEAGLGPVWEEA